MSDMEHASVTGRAIRVEGGQFGRQLITPRWKRPKSRIEAG